MKRRRRVAAASPPPPPPPQEPAELKKEAVPVVLFRPPHDDQDDDDELQPQQQPATLLQRAVDTLVCLGVNALTHHLGLHRRSAAFAAAPCGDPLWLRLVDALCCARLHHSVESMQRWRELHLIVRGGESMQQRLLAHFATSAPPEPWMHP